jgi:hypothetical protein
MKKIDIQGKRNQDKMKQMADPDAFIEKKMPKNRKKIDEKYYTDQSLGLSLLKEYNPVQTTTDTGNNVSVILPIQTNIITLEYIVREIELKRKAYIYQDKHHEIYDPMYSITTNRIIELIVSSELLCYYCREICQLTYKESMCRKQWTLDRIDNDYGHNHTNVVIACLDCNLKRGTMDSERFRQGKQFTFRKLE